MLNKPNPIHYSFLRCKYNIIVFNTTVCFIQAPFYSVFTTFPEGWDEL